MPEVGNKKYPYTEEGMAAAKAESEKTGIPMKDGSMRSEQMYAGGGKTGYNMIGMEKPMMMGGGKMKMKYRHGGMTGMKKYEEGGKAMKAVDAEKNPGLSKLPKKVRNKMGYMEDGGKMPKYKDGGLTKRQEKTLKKHSKHHTKKHMSSMKKDMMAGKTFSAAHKKAIKKVGK